ncbi:MAG: rhodanese-like domain-containing protein [Sulfitobacter sp.]
MSDPTMVSRRAIVAMTMAFWVAGPVSAKKTAVPTKGGDITPRQAHELANMGKILLLDIRRPNEWAATGSGAGAQRLDMRREDFVDALLKLVAGDRSAPIALICARGVRSHRTSRRLQNAGFTNVIDVPEGMLGSHVGPGWIKRGLPLDRS